VHKTVQGKYKTTHKKVVSNFRKERMGRISFLNPTGAVSIAIMLPYILRFPSGYVAVLTKSLCIAQDFLTAIWLCWSWEQGQFRGSSK
jgi:hypothetical protein